MAECRDCEERKRQRALRETTPQLHPGVHQQRSITTPTGSAPGYRLRKVPDLPPGGQIWDMVWDQSHETICVWDGTRWVCFTPGAGADCMFNYLVSECWEGEEGKEFPALTGCTFKVFSQVQLAIEDIEALSISGSEWSVWICPGVYTPVVFTPDVTGADVIEFFGSGGGVGDPGICALRGEVGSAPVVDLSGGAGTPMTRWRNMFFGDATGYTAEAIVNLDTLNLKAEFEECNFFSLASASYSIDIGRSVNVRVSGCKISGNNNLGIIGNGQSDGLNFVNNIVEAGDILIEDTHDVQIVGNLFHGTKIRIGDGDRNAIVGNTFQNTPADTIVIEIGEEGESQGNVISGNSFTSDSQIGVWPGVDGLAIVGNIWNSGANNSTRLKNLGAGAARNVIFTGNSLWADFTFGDITSFTAAEGNFAYSVFGPNAPATECRYNVTGGPNEFYPGSSWTGSGTGAGTVSTDDPLLIAEPAAHLTGARQLSGRNDIFLTDEGAGGLMLIDSWLEGVAIPSATTLELGHDGNYFHVTGATGITALHLDPASVFADLVLGDGATAYWRMNEASGNIADATGNGNTGVQGGTPTYSQAGILTGEPTNMSIAFDGSADYFEAADSADVDPADVFTVEALFRYVDNGANQCIMSKNAGGFYFGVRASGDRPLLGQSGGTDILVGGPATALVNGNEYHLVITKNGSAMKMYLNGVDVTPGSANQTLVATSSVLGIARDPNGNTRHFAGDIDELAIYAGVILTLAQVQSHYDTSVATLTAGYRVLLTFDGACTLTHSASLILQGATNYTTSAGDVLEFIYEGSNVWREINRHESAGHVRSHDHSNILDSASLNAAIYTINRLQLHTATAKTISGGVISVVVQNVSHLVIDTEAAAATDDLDTINGPNDNQLLFIRAANDARTVVVKHGTGNIQCVGNADISLDDDHDYAILLYNPDISAWMAMSGGGGGGGGGGSLTVQRNDSTIDAAATTLDFSGEFEVASSPAGEANMSLSKASQWFWERT